MKKISFFLLALFLVLEISSVIAQTTVLPGNNSTSGNGRAPQGSRKWINTKYIISSAEMTSSGFAGVVSSVGWRWNVPSPPAATGPTAQNVATTGNLRVYLKDTVAGATSIGSSLIDTMGVGYTKVIDGTISIPAGLGEINIDVPAGGPGTAPYTPTPGSGVLVIFVYKTTDVALATPTGAPNVFCSNTATNGLSTFQSNAASPVNGQTGALSAFRPETRFGAPILSDDVGISASNLNNGRVFSVGKCYDFTATVKNFGTTTQNVIPVYYKVDGGPAVGPVNTVGPILQNGTENVTFSGGLALCGLTAGLHTINIYTDLQPSPPAVNRAPLSVVISVSAKIAAFPYVENFTLATGWTASGVALWALAPCVNPDGVAADNAARANFYNVSTGAAVLKSPEMDFTGVSNPVLNFYVAYKTFADETDRLQVLVSVDGGLTFNPATTPYDKTWSSDPSLATLPFSTTQYTPTAEIQWRHETVDLSNVGNLPNVVIGFVGTTAFGNNAWVDNVIVSQPSGLCSDDVPGPGVHNLCKVTLDFTATPLPPFNTGENIADKQSASVKNIDLSVDNNSTLLSAIPIINSGNQLDNPNGGTVFVSQYYNNDPGQVVLIGGTNAQGDPGPPSVVYYQGAHWFRITYDGNDYQGYATYNLEIDVTDYGLSAVSTWIVKRTDATGVWTALTTTNPSGNILRVTGLTDFCDFGLAGDAAQPVELASFVSTINGNDVTLNWATTTETNNSGFDIERSSLNGSWSKVGNVTGNGTVTTPHNYSFTDRNVASGTYSYRLKQIDFNGNFEYFSLNNEVNVGIPQKFELSQNYPNPFNPSTSINFDLPFDAKVSIKVFDLSGKEVATLVNGAITAGYHSVNFNASGLSSGVYFYRINAEGSGNNFVATKKMSLIK